MLILTNSTLTRIEGTIEAQHQPYRDFDVVGVGIVSDLNPPHHPIFRYNSNEVGGVNAAHSQPLLEFRTFLQRWPNRGFESYFEGLSYFWCAKDILLQIVFVIQG